MSNAAKTIQPQTDIATKTVSLDRCLPWLLAATAILVVFYQLGSAALFEPDEGRNAEKAREILLLSDWLTPHENFYPVLDKPMLFYWLIALSYKLFGVSEWAARLTSALAALGCVLAVYIFTRIHWGKAQALWSALILLTSLEFFMFARLVIFDMLLTFILTLALSAFYLAGRCENVDRRRLLCLVMYMALGVATLIKGLIGIVLPGMVIFCYLLLTQCWSVLRRINLLPGVLLFCAIVLPWYLAMGAHHEGYLRYYFWEEHFGRYMSEEFGRTEPWYYFILAGLIGFFPWTLLWPWLIAGFRRRAWDDQTLFLLLWAGLPLLFFSASKSKLPHYILPIFPALAMLTASRLVSLLDQFVDRVKRALSLTRIAYGLVVLYFLIGYWLPAILPREIIPAVLGMPRGLRLYGVVILIVTAILSWAQISLRRSGKGQIFLAQTVIMIAFIVFTAHAMIAASAAHSAKAAGETARSLLTDNTQVVVYDTYLAGLAFYLRSDEPIWVITRDKRKRTFLGNYYTLGERAVPEIRWGQALFDFDEFGVAWRAAKRPVLVLAHSKRRAQLEQQVGLATRKLASVGTYVWLTKN